MINHIQDTVELSNGVRMPWLGLGVWQSQEGEEVEQSVLWALEQGYRSIDTAAIYRNEAGVGKALKSSGISREEIFLTTKVWNSDHGFESTLKAFETSQELLDTPYIDLYLIHWPVVGKYKETWRALELLYKEQKVRAIGVSNFLVHHLKDLLPACEVKPMLDQVEFHPHLIQPTLLDYCRTEGIQLEAWSPLMQGKVVDVPELIAIGEKYGKSAVQVTLRWNLQHGVITIPKSVKRERIISNSEIFDFELSEDDMMAIDALDRGARVGPDPDNFDF
ncbi:MAG: aldo/keto reductase [Cyclobacteriaceae bacterium]|nr:aldo/keto reductase [Cyclobacteriaceae bacterium]